MAKARAKRVKARDAEQPYFELYRELREEIRSSGALPEGWDPVIEMAKLSQEKTIGPALKFLCLKEVASYTRPRMNQASEGRVDLTQRSNGEIGGAMGKFLEGPR